jgi:cytoskeleton protein RodZ
MTQSIGQKLKQAREEQRITLEIASESTRIRMLYLQALEVGDLSVLPSPVQARGFLRNYAEYLGLDFDRMLAELRADQSSADEIIGPADESPEAATLMAEPPPPQVASPLLSPKPDSITQPDSSLDLTPEKPTRRGRKKAEPVAEPAEISQPEVTAEPAPPVEDEPSVATFVDLPEQTAALPSDKSDGLWQTWLNRISSVIPARKKQTSESPERTESEDEGAGEQDQDQVSESLSQEMDPAQNSESNRIFREIGEELRKRRELLSLHLEEVERNTHVKAHYLEALEKGTMENLPSTVQTRGMLSNYATFLDLDVDALLLRYADALQAWYREKNPQKTVRRAGQPMAAKLPPMRSFIAGDMIFGIGMAILLIGFSIWGINWVVMTQNQKDVQPTGPSISEILLASPDSSAITPTTTLVAIESFQEPTSTIVIPTQNLNVNVQVNLVAVERTYMRVLADGEEVFNGRVVPGTAYPFEAEEQIEILVGSGAAIRIVYNGRDLGLLGGLGQVVSNIYLADEILTPTSRPAPTATRTVPATSTVPSTLTPVPSTTPTP